MTNADIRAIFDDSVLEYSGITREQVQQQGLPYGNYQLCIEACHYPPEQAPRVYGTGCASFSIQSVQPAVHQTVQVLPPYTKPLNDYLSVSKIRSTVTVSQYPSDRAHISMRAEIRKTDQSLTIRSDSSAEITLVRSGGVFPPHTLTQADLDAAFRYIFADGISMEELLQNGLPDGTYVLCFLLYDHSGNETLPLGEFCSAPFTIESVQPVVSQTVQVLPPTRTSFRTTLREGRSAA